MAVHAHLITHIHMFTCKKTTADTYEYADIIRVCIYLLNIIYNIDCRVTCII